MSGSIRRSPRSVDGPGSGCSENDACGSGGDGGDGGDSVVARDVLLEGPDGVDFCRRMARRGVNSEGIAARYDESISTCIDIEC